MNLAVAVLTGSTRQSLVGAKPSCCELISPIQGRIVAKRQVVALLAQEGSLGYQQLVVIRAMWGMAIGTVLAHRSVLPQERATLLRMAGVTQRIGAFGLQQRLGSAAMWVVAIHTGHLAFVQGHVRTLVEFVALLLMTGFAGVVDGALGQQTVDRVFLHWIVAIRTAQLIARVNRARPVQLTAAGMTAQTLLVLFGYWRTPLLGETNQGVLVPGVLNVQ